ncbi:MAG: hypothetical protein WA633_26425 [Stellaceae bacterium]
MTQIANIGNPNPSDPAHYATAVTPSDTTDLAAASTAIFIGGAGNLRVTMLGGGSVTFAGLPVGWHPIRVTRVWATSTTATNIVAVWR